MPFYDESATAKKNITWANIKNALQSRFLKLSGGLMTGDITFYSLSNKIQFRSTNSSFTAFYTNLMAEEYFPESGSTREKTLKLPNEDGTLLTDNKFACWEISFDTYFGANIPVNGYARAQNVPYPKTYASAPKMLIGTLALDSGGFVRGAVIEFDTITASKSSVSISNGVAASIDRGVGWKIKIFAIF